MKAKRKGISTKSKKVVRKKVARKPAAKQPARKAVATKAPARKGKALSRIEDYLLEHKIRYTLIRHAKAYTAQEIAAAEHVSGKQHVKVVIVAAKGQHVLAVLPAAARVDFKKLGKLVGKSVSLAKEDVLKTLFPDCDIGAMPPLASLYNLPMFVDKSLAQNQEIVFQGGTHTDAIKVAYADFAKLETPSLGEFAQYGQKAR